MSIHLFYTQIRPVTHSSYAHSKSVSYAVWYPNLARAHVTVARGVHFTSMGHSAQRPVPPSSPPTGSGKSLKKRLELLPEETLYLVEKGALFCWKASCDDGPGEDVVDWDSSSQGAPMSVQQAYAEMIGTQDLTLDRYQVCIRPPFSPSLSLSRLYIDFRLPSSTWLHSNSSETSFPFLSRSCCVPIFTPVIHGVDFPQGVRRALLTGTQIPELVSRAVNHLVAASRPSAMASP